MVDRRADATRVIGLDHPGHTRPVAPGQAAVVRPDQDEPVGVDAFAELLRREHAGHDRHAVRPVLREDPQRQPLPDEVALAGDDHHDVARLAGLLLERRSDLAVDRIAQVRQQQAEGAGPPDAEAAGGRVRDVVQVGRRSLDRLAGADTDARIVRERSRGRRAGDVRPLGDILEEDPTALAVPVHRHAPVLPLDRDAKGAVSPGPGPESGALACPTRRAGPVAAQVARPGDVGCRTVARGSSHLDRTLHPPCNRLRRP